MQNKIMFSTNESDTGKDLDSEHEQIKRLMLAVILRACLDAHFKPRTKHGKNKEELHSVDVRLREEAVCWLTSNSTEFMTFRSCCEVLNCDYKAIRDKVLSESGKLIAKSFFGVRSSYKLKAKF